MAYTFRGVFIERPAKSERELEELFDGYARSTEAPFVGVVLSLRDDSRLDDPYDFDYSSDKIHVLEKSCALPDTRVAFIYYRCWGGTLDYVAGFACCNGELVADSERDTDAEGYANSDESEKIGDKIFIALLEWVGAQSPSLNFPPFERGYFPNT